MPTETTNKVIDEHVFLVKTVESAILLVVASTAVAISLVGLFVSDLERPLVVRSYVTSLILCVIIAPPAIGCSAWQHLRHYRTLLKFHKLAFTDVLTQLPNRRFFMEKGQERLDAAKISDKAIAILLIDIDHFKRVNDRFGHDIGDVTLTTVANVLIDEAGHDALVARLGGEEFAIMLPFEQVNEVCDRSNALLERVAQKRFFGNGELFSLTISIGCKLALNGGSVSAALTCADKALYEAKESGRNRLSLVA